MSFTVPHHELVFNTMLDWVELPVTVNDIGPNAVITLLPFLAGVPQANKWIVRSTGTFRVSRWNTPAFITLIGAKRDESKAYIALNVDIDNAVSLVITAVDEEGGGTGGGGDTESHIAGTVTIDGAPAVRTVIVISEDPGGREVLATGVSESDGSFDISYFDWDGPVIALALDDYGVAYQASTLMNLGTVVHPTTPNGYVFVVTEAGTSGVTEPAWSTSSSTTSGSVTFAPQPYYRPVASGPLDGELIES